LPPNTVTVVRNTTLLNRPAPAAAKTWLLAQIEKKQAGPAAPTAETTPEERFIPSRLAA